MQVCQEIKKLRNLLDQYRYDGKAIGFVPTMGYLHKGHLSLIESSAKENDITVLSIYINPTQFGPNEDLDQYPRDLENDKKLAEEAGADIIFIPDNEMMYKTHHATFVNVNGLTNHLCGASRPTHFEGVTTIVTKLFNIVQPNRAYFGQKDAQQAIVIKRMVEDLNMPLKVVVCPIVREKDGLAMSSRNAYLSKEERKQATILYKALQEAKSRIEQGQRSATEIRDLMEQMIQTQPAATIDYVSIVSEKTLEDIDVLEGKILIALAVKMGKTRLIDNLRLEVN
ncbi:pantoate--beta-alanine ligase [Vallitalea okinawensis]|uniref:pantoate--beta-alanine ligase n=1 Tax=Vallitalea okinawensis TaxID=2078660 RepID=UPI000CFDC55E|nr:pantoate--beta-alanine ligase [Vallitalea okinawensis]